METLNWVIIIQLFAVLAIIIVKEYFAWRHKKPIVVHGNPGAMPSAKAGDIESHYWDRRFDALERQNERIITAVTDCGAEMSGLRTIIEERLPRH